MIYEMMQDMTWEEKQEILVTMNHDDEAVEVLDDFNFESYDPDFNGGFI